MSDLVVLAEERLRPAECVVLYLTEALRLARQGELRSVAIVGVDAEGGVRRLYDTAEADPRLLLAGLSIQHQALLDYILSQTEWQSEPEFGEE